MKPRTDLSGPPTRASSYSEELLKSQETWWRRLFNVQAPYRWNLRQLGLGFTLDIGCGLGRHLLHLKGNGVGVDHNRTSIEYARSQGLVVFTQEEFQKSGFFKPQRFDSLLLSHVAEHMTREEVVSLLRLYTPLLRTGGKLVTITPQEAGFRKDKTHREFMDFGKLRGIAKELGLTPLKEYSFPFPHCLGRFFYFNEFISVSVKTGTPEGPAISGSF
jgi:SAM-dependent methyltransferase